MKYKNQILELIYAMLVILWSYASVTKLSNMERSRLQMLNQIFPPWIAEVLAWLVPLTELLLAILLLFRGTRPKALFGSLFLLVAFSGYVGLVMTGIFGRIPCSCGGILTGMSYSVHLVFNLCYTAIAAAGLYLQHHDFPYHTNNQQGKEAV